MGADTDLRIEVKKKKKEHQARKGSTMGTMAIEFFIRKEGVGGARTRTPFPPISKPCRGGEKRKRARKLAAAQLALHCRFDQVLVDFFIIR